MKAVELQAVEGDPVRGGCHIKELGSVLELNRQAFIEGKERSLVVLSVQPTLEKALDAEAELKRLRKEQLKNEKGKHHE